jgi:hypothetical protein
MFNVKDKLPRAYYYLLDWNDRDNHQLIDQLYNKQAISQLTKEECCAFFEIVTKIDLRTLKT